MPGPSGFRSFFAHMNQKAYGTALDFGFWHKLVKWIAASLSQILKHPWGVSYKIFPNSSWILEPCISTPPLPAPIPDCSPTLTGYVSFFCLNVLFFCLLRHVNCSWRPHGFKPSTWLLPLPLCQLLPLVCPPLFLPHTSLKFYLAAPPLTNPLSISKFCYTFLSAIKSFSKSSTRCSSSLIWAACGYFGFHSPHPMPAVIQ